jgi:preprotein translocase subunit YajC
MKEHQNMLSQLKRGDKVLTTGGILATVVKVTDDKEIILEISENVQVRAVRAAVSEVITRS